MTLPSSRTPEGDPLHCQMCGHECSIEFTEPPGDVVCPACGCFAWRDESFGHLRHSFEADKTLWMIEQSKQFLDQSFDRIAKGGHSEKLRWELLLRLMLMVSESGGGSYWSMDRSRWFPWIHSVRMQAAIGDRPSAIFVRRIRKTGRAEVSSVRVHGKPRLLIGVPVWSQDQCQGIVVFDQPADRSVASIRAAMRFAQSIGQHMNRTSEVQL